VTLLAREWQNGVDGAWHHEKIDPRYSGRLGRDRGFARAAQRRFGDFDLVQSHERIPGAAIFRAGDGVHAGWLEQQARVLTMAGQFRRFLSPYHHYLLAAEKEMFRHPALRLVICNSKIVRNDIAERFGVAQDKLVLVYNGVDTTAFHPSLTQHRARIRRTWDIPNDAPLLAFVGSGFARKGVVTALEAILPHPELHLLVVGRDKSAVRYRRHAEKLGIAPRVHFLDVVQDVKPIYGASDALILPTLYDPFPNVCVEALACGLPLFTSQMCGAADWILEGRNGWINDALDVEGYRHAIGEWLGRGHDWRALRAAARATAEPYTLGAMALELEALYARVLTS